MAQRSRPELTGFEATPMRTPGWLSFDELTRACSSTAWANILPHPKHNLCALHALVKNAFDASQNESLLGSSESVIVVVADGVSFALARELWSPSWLGALTSTCPSTSSTALLCANTGLTPASHGIIGVAFYDARLDAIFNCYS